MLEQRVDAQLCEMLELVTASHLGESAIELVRVRLVVLEVVDAHRGLVNVRLERTILVRHRRERQVLAQGTRNN